MQSGKIQYAIHNGTYVIQISGDVRVSFCAALDAFLNAMFEDESLNAILIDLSGADALDSTTLGLLARVAVRFNEQFGRFPALFCANQDIQTMLASMGLDVMFDYISSMDIQAVTMDELPVCDAAEDELCKKIIEAHQQLVSLNEKNAETFKDVLDLMSKQQY